MKRWKLTTGAIFFIAVIVAVLFYNKSRMAKATPKGIQDVYYVTVDHAVKKNLSESLSIVGVINANNDVNVISETQGKVTQVFAKVGDYVKGFDSSTRTIRDNVVVSVHKRILEE